MRGRRAGCRPAGSAAGAPARARGGVPIGVGVLGRVRSPAAGPAGAGRDRDLDGIPGRYDVDDDGDLVLDVREQALRGERAVVAGAPVAGGGRGR